MLLTAVCVSWKSQTPWQACVPCPGKQAGALGVHLVKLHFGVALMKIPLPICPRNVSATHSVQAAPVTAARRVICPRLAGTALQECREAVEAAGYGDSRKGCSVQLSRLAAFQPAQRSQAALEAQRAGILSAVGTLFIQNGKQSLP